MKKLITLSLLFLTACSNDDNPMGDLQEQSLPSSFTVIGEDISNVWQLNYDGETERAEQLNLTAELALDPNYLTLRQNESQLSFYSFESGFFTLTQKDIETGTSNVLERFYENTDQRSIVWGTNSFNSIFFGFYAPLGSTNLALRIIDINSFEGEDVTLEFGINRLFQPLYENGKLFITYQDGMGNYKVSVYSVSEGIIIRTLAFGTATPSIFIDDMERLAVLKSEQGRPLQLERYELQNLERQSVTEISTNLSFAPGPLDVQLIADTLFYTFVYLQPAPLVAGPAILDILTQENTVIDMFTLVGNVQVDTGKNLQLTAQYYSAKNKVFYVGYVNTNETDTTEGGVLIISDQGQLLKDVEMPFVPTYFVKD